MDRDIASRYIRDNFKPSDQLAVVLLNKRTGAVTQRIATAERTATPEFQAWLRHKNAQKHEIYISMNALHPGAKGRTKGDIAAVRHLYLDFDENGTQAVEKLLARTDLPRPNYRISTSPGKYQVVWKVEGFSPDQAERLQKSLARETGADPAATDSARVLRLPGFYNHKYEKPYFVSVEALVNGVNRFEDFPVSSHTPNGVASDSGHGRRAVERGVLSQSEHDWAYAKRALARGEKEEIVIAAIAVRRGSDKSNPQYYAELTVRKATQSLSAETGRAKYPPTSQTGDSPHPCGRDSTCRVDGYVSPQPGFFSLDLIESRVVQLDFDASLALNGEQNRSHSYRLHRDPA